MEHLNDALIVTVIGMGIIFLVLIILLFTIVILNKLFPYKQSQAPMEGGAEPEIVAVIQAAIAKYTRRKPADIRIKSIK